MSRRVSPPEDGAQLVVHDLDDLLSGREALGKVDPDELLTDPGHEVPDHPEIDVRLQQRQTDLPERLVHVRGAEPPAAAQAAEDGIEAVGQALEHCG